MVDIKKLIVQVKRGNCSYNSFSTRVRQAANGEPGDIPLDPGDIPSDAADEWLAQRKRQQQPIPDSPLSPSLPIDSSHGVSEDVEYNMDAWVRDNQKGMDRENQLDIMTLINQKNKEPEKSILDPSPTLYRAMISNPKLYDVLGKKIRDMTGISDENKVNLFIETMISKTRNILRDIDEAEKDHTSTQDMVGTELEKPPVEVPVVKPTGQTDINVAVKLEEKFFGLEPWAQKELLAKAGIKNFEEKMPLIGLAIDKKFGNPSNDKVVDQRMNFFLYNPDKLPAMDEGEESVIKKELGELGLDNSDIGAAFGSIVGVSASNKGTPQVRMTRLLKKLMGDKLLGILLEMIENLDPSIMGWMAKGFYEDRRTSYDQHDRPSGDAMSQTLQEGTTPADAAEFRASEIEKQQGADAFTGLFSRIVQQYLQPMMEGADVARQTALNDWMSDSINKFKQAPNVESKQNALQSYKDAEEINAFAIPMIEHFQKLVAGESKKLDVKGKKSSKSRTERKDSSTMRYKNDKGVMYVPDKILQEIYKLEQQGPRELDEPEKVELDDFDYDALVERYLKRMKNGEVDKFELDWKTLVTHQFPKESFKEMGLLKKEIVKFSQQNQRAVSSGETNIIRTHILSTNYKDSILKFAGVNTSDPASAVEEKIDNFIFMTLNQSKDHIEWLQTLGSRKGGGLKSGNKPHHNLIAEIGSKYIPMLGYLINAIDAPDAVTVKQKADPKYVPTPEEVRAMNSSQHYVPDSVNTLISLLSHHSDISRFLRKGRAKNSIDEKHRTNTELYYTLKGQDYPPHIDALLDIFYTGLEESNTGTLQHGSWYSKFFQEYGQFEKAYSEVEERQEFIDEQEHKLHERYQKLNPQAAKIVEDPMKYNKMLKKIQDPIERAKVDEAMRAWDRISPLDSYYYARLGVTHWKGLDKEKRDLDKLQKGYKVLDKKGNPVIDKNGEEMVRVGIETLNEDMAVIKDKLNLILQQSGYKPRNESALRLSYRAYRRALVKIAHLERMKKSNVKLASVGHIDVFIARIKTEFDHYFNSLFS